MRRLQREVLEALWTESRALREDAAKVHAMVRENQRQSEALRARIAFGRARTKQSSDGVLAKS